MNQKTALQAGRERQCRQKLLMLLAQLRMRPSGSGRTERAAWLRRVERHRIVIALEHYRASLRQLHDAVHHQPRVTAVADQVAEQGELVCALLLCMVQASMQGLQIGMNVR